MDEVDELTEVVEFEEEADLAGKLVGLDEVDGLPEEDMDSEDGSFAAELVPELTGTDDLSAPQPAVARSRADRQMIDTLRIFKLC